MDIAKYKRYWPCLMGLVLIIPTLFLMSENAGRSIFIIISTLLWISFSIFTKKPVLSSLLYILFVLPFNITLLLPTSVVLFNTELISTSTYVDGLYSNYLVPTLSILDIGIVLFLISFLFEKGFPKLLSSLKTFLIPLGILIFVIILQNILNWDLLLILNSTRFLFYILFFVVLVDWIKTDWRKEMLKYILLIVLFNILIQGVIGIFQFDGGSSLGLTFLGESQVVNGMQGSSFIFLNDQIYLRAYGTFPHPNVLGGFFVLSFVIGWLSSLLCKKHWKWLAYSVMVLSLIFSLFTFSRISIFVIGLGVFLFAISHFRRGRFYSFSFGLIVERFINLFVGGDTSWVDRKNLMGVSFDVIKQKLILGTGFGNFVRYMDGIVPRTGGGILLLQPVHNVFLLFVSEFGVLGVIGFVWFLIKYFRNFVDFKSNVYLKIFILLIFLIIGMFDHYLLSLPQGMVMGMLLLGLMSV